MRKLVVLALFAAGIANGGRPVRRGKEGNMPRLAIIGLVGASRALLSHRFARASLPLVVVLALSSSLTHVSLAAARPKQDVAKQFVLAANRGDFRTVCRLYSSSYLKVSRADCQALYRWGVRLYGCFDYRIVARRRLRNGHWHIALTRWHGPSFIELAHEPGGWRIVAGGW